MAAEVLIHNAAGAVAPFDQNKGHVLEGVDVCTGGKLPAHLLCPLPEDLVGKAAGHYQHQVLLGEGYHLHTLHHDGLEADDQIHTAVGQLILQMGGVSLKQREFYHGELCLKLGQHLGQQSQPAGVGDAHPEHSHVLAVDIPHFG